MSSRVSMPATVSSGSLQRSGEGVTFANSASPAASNPSNAAASRTLVGTPIAPSNVQSSTPNAAAAPVTTPSPTTTPMVFQTNTVVAPVDIPVLSPISPPSSSDMMGKESGESSQLIGAGESQVSETAKKSWGYKFKAIYLIVAVIVFIAVWILLFTGKFNFVTDLTEGQRLINTRKLLIFTIIIGAAINVCIFAGVGMYRRSKA